MLLSLFNILRPLRARYRNSVDELQAQLRHKMVFKSSDLVYKVAIDLAYCLDEKSSVMTMAHGDVVNAGNLLISTLSWVVVEPELKLHNIDCNETHFHMPSELSKVRLDVRFILPLV